MMIIINSSNYKNLIKGASLFTTGGGLALREQVKSLKKLKNLKVQLRPISEFPKDAYLCMVAELGSSDAPPIKKEKNVFQMFELLKKVSGKNIGGLYPPEIGQESILLEAAYYLKLPIADFDLAGFRAVPYIDINILNLRKIRSSFTPLIVGSDQGKIIAVEEKATSERVEEILRSMTNLFKTKVIFILGAVISVNEIIENAISNSSLSRAMDYGRISEMGKLCEMLNPKMIIEGTVIKRTELNEKGFSARIVLVVDKKGDQYKLVILNEVIFVLDENNKIVSSIPERILLIDPQRLNGIQSGDLNTGVKVTVLAIAPEKPWQTKKALKLFGKERFSFLLKKFSEKHELKI